MRYILLLSATGERAAGKGEKDDTSQPMKNTAPSLRPCDATRGASKSKGPSGPADECRRPGLNVYGSRKPGDDERSVGVSPGDERLSIARAADAGASNVEVAAINPDFPHPLPIPPLPLPFAPVDTK